MADESDNGRISFTTKELLSRIEGKLDMLANQLQMKADMSSVHAVTSRVETLERDMQEGKETVKSMLIPQFNDVIDRLAKFESLVSASAHYRAQVDEHTTRLKELERTALTDEAISKYRKWLIVTAIPAVVGATWALLRLLDVIKLP